MEIFDEFSSFFAQNISEGSYICAKKEENSRKDLWNSSETNPKLRLLVVGRVPLPDSLYNASPEFEDANSERFAQVKKLGAAYFFPIHS
jgi:hypothetical protein